MKLCVIFPFYPPNKQIGGIEDYSRILVERFRGMGVDTYIIASGEYAGDDKKVFKIGSNGPWGLNELLASIKIIKETIQKR